LTVPVPVHSHRAPDTLGDRLAWALAWGTDKGANAVFGRRHAHRALVLETVAAVPGMIGALVAHLRALRRIEPQDGGVEALTREAQNERFHLLVFSTIAQPVWWERLLIRVAQAFFVCGYTTLYVLSRPVAHRFVGYLEEHAVTSYTRYLDDLRRDPTRDTPAPPAAIRYWDLPPDATMIDVVEAVRCDEVNHREENHGLADCRGTRSTNWLPSPSP